MNGAKHSILALLMMSIFMTSCNDNLMDMESSLTSTNSLEPMTRSTSDSICEDDATLLEETDELKRLYEKYLISSNHLREKLLSPLQMISSTQTSMQSTKCQSQLRSARLQHLDLRLDIITFL